MTNIEDVLMADQKKGQTENTTARNTLKEQTWKGWPVHAAIGIALLLSLLYLANYGNWNFFWLLAVGIGVWYSGSKLASSEANKDLIWIWPTALKVIGAAIVIITLANSGFTKLFSAGVSRVETAASCAADPSQAKCAAQPSPVPTVTRAAPATVVPAIPAGALTSITVPSCNTGWSAEIPLHGSKWQMTPAWSAKTTMMSFLIDGEWSQATSIALSGGSHIRYCTTKDTLTGKTMPLNWKWLGN